MTNSKDVIDFLIEAKKATYAGYGSPETPTRPGSHDFKHTRDGLMYIDTYLGGRRFSGEEALFREGEAFWAMNYSGRVIGVGFDGDFLKEALRNVPADMPYRGPEIFKSGENVYKCCAVGNFDWFIGHEEILRADKLVYECKFHGGTVEQ